MNWLGRANSWCEAGNILEGDKDREALFMYFYALEALSKLKAPLLGEKAEDVKHNPLYPENKFLARKRSDWANHTEALNGNKGLEGIASVLETRFSDWQKKVAHAVSFKELRDSVKALNELEDVEGDWDEVSLGDQLGHTEQFQSMFKGVLDLDDSDIESLESGLQTADVASDMESFYDKAVDSVPEDVIEALEGLMPVFFAQLRLGCLKVAFHHVRDTDQSIHNRLRFSSQEELEDDEQIRLLRENVSCIGENLQQVIDAYHCCQEILQRIRERTSDSPRKG